MRFVLCSVAVSLLFCLPASAGEKEKSPKTQLTDERREALAGQGLTRTELLNPDTLNRLSLGVDENAKPQDRAWLKTDLSQVQADIALFDKLSKNPASASGVSDLEKKLDRMEKYLDAARVAQLRKRLRPGKADNKKEEPAEEKKARAEEKNEKGLRTVSVPFPSAGSGGSSLTDSETDIEEEDAWWKYYYCVYYLQPLTGESCD